MHKTAHLTLAALWIILIGSFSVQNQLNFVSIMSEFGFTALSQTTEWGYSSHRLHELLNRAAQPLFWFYQAEITDTQAGFTFTLRKIGHFCTYFMLAFFIFPLMRTHAKNPYLATLILGIFVALGDEWIQFYLPGPRLPNTGRAR